MYGFFDHFLPTNFAVKGIVGELSKSFLLVEVGAPNDYRATFVGRIDTECPCVYEGLIVRTIHRV